MEFGFWLLSIELIICKHIFWKIKIWCSWSWGRSSSSAQTRFPGCCRGRRPSLTQICVFCCRLDSCRSCSWTCLLEYSCWSASWLRGLLGLDYFECFLPSLLITAFVITAFVSFVVIAFASVAGPAPAGTWPVSPFSLIPFTFMLAAIFVLVPIDFFCFPLPVVIIGLLAHLVSSGLTSRIRSLDCVATRTLGSGSESATLTVLHPCPVASSAASSSLGSCGLGTGRACSSKQIQRLGL